MLESARSMLEARGPRRRSRRWGVGARCGRPGARAWLAWIVLLALMAVFAPFLANSMPVAVKIDGQWSSPLLRSLTAADVTLVALALVAMIAVGLFRVKWVTGALIAVFVSAVTLPLAIWPTIVQQ